jgi:DNA-binding CsgD family transcriptional regulator
MALFQPLAHLAGLEMMAGRYARAKKCAERSVAAALQSGRPFAEFFARAFLAQVLAYLGEAVAARANVESALPLAERSSAHHTLMLQWIPGFLELSLGKPREAHAVLGPCADLQQARRRIVYPPDMMHWVVDDVEALVQLGDLDQARERCEWVEGHVWRGHAGWASAVTQRARGLVAAGAGNIDEAILLLQGSAAAWRTTSQPFPLARVLLTLGAVQRRARQTRAAREALEEALEIFARIGARLWAENARAEFAQVGGRKSSPGRLTPTEEQIAALVVAGRSNAEVAHALFVSPKTVEWNLSKIYRKLGVRSRTELAAKHVSRVPPPPA